MHRVLWKLSSPDYLRKSLWPAIFGMRFETCWISKQFSNENKREPFSVFGIIDQMQLFGGVINSVRNKKNDGLENPMKRNEQKLKIENHVRKQIRESRIIRYLQNHAECDSYVAEAHGGSTTTSPLVHRGGTSKLFQCKLRCIGINNNNNTIVS